MADEFTCDGCGGTFEKGRSDEDALAEMVETFVPPPIDEGIAVLCDECWEAFMNWARKQTPSILRC